jgi:predicted RNA-binding protein with PIN domain
MPYLIDGHNLIPHITGLSLQQADDEIKLIEVVRNFCNTANKQAEIYFDGAPPGESRNQKFGRVKAIFVPKRSTADAAIRDRLIRMGNAARNWTVVTSDRQVLANARSMGATTRSSNEFAAQMKHAQLQNPAQTDDVKLSESEVDEWLKLFGDDS